MALMTERQATVNDDGLTGKRKRELKPESKRILARMERLEGNRGGRVSLEVLVDWMSHRGWVRPQED